MQPHHQSALFVGKNSKEVRTTDGSNFSPYPAYDLGDMRFTNAEPSGDLGVRYAALVRPQ